MATSEPQGVKCKKGAGLYALAPGDDLPVCGHTRQRRKQSKAGKHECSKPWCHNYTANSGGLCTTCLGAYRKER